MVSYIVIGSEYHARTVYLLHSRPAYTVVCCNRLQWPAQQNSQIADKLSIRTVVYVCARRSKTTGALAVNQLINRRRATSIPRWQLASTAAAGADNEMNGPLAAAAAAVSLIIHASVHTSLHGPARLSATLQHCTLMRCLQTSISNAVSLLGAHGYNLTVSECEYNNSRSNTTTNKYNID